MGRVKDWLIDLENQERDEWIRDQLGDDEADESTVGWDELGEKYDAQKEGYLEAVKLEEEYQWHQHHKSSEFYEQFKAEIRGLRDILDSSTDTANSNTFYKMVYAHSMTLLESFLGEAIKSLVVTNESFLANAVTKIPELRDIRPSLEEVLVDENVVLTKTLGWLSTVLFHNLPKVVRIYSSVLAAPIDIDIEKVSRIVAIRHDIVHRNGKSIEGDTIVMNRDAVIEAINSITEFARGMQSYIFEAKNA